VREQQEGGKNLQKIDFYCLVQFTKYLQGIQNNNGTSTACSMRNTNLSEKEAEGM
jgi:hypothetical protein